MVQISFYVLLALVVALSVASMLSGAGSYGCSTGWSAGRITEGVADRYTTGGARRAGAAAKDLTQFQNLLTVSRGGRR